MNNLQVYDDKMHEGILQFKGINEKLYVTVSNTQAVGYRAEKKRSLMENCCHQIIGFLVPLVTIELIQCHGMTIYQSYDMLKKTDMNSVKLVILLHFISRKKRLQTML